jgi:hypothetical protein
MRHALTLILLLFALSASAADAYITEYRDLMNVPSDAAQIAKEPVVAEQKITLGAATASSAFNAATRIVRVHCTAGCSISFGTAPVATTSMQRIPADGVEYKGIPAGQSYKISVVSNP